MNFHSSQRYDAAGQGSSMSDGVTDKDIPLQWIDYRVSKGWLRGKFFRPILSFASYCRPEVIAVLPVGHRHLQPPLRF
ncbi:MAG: hypothetical protein HQM09_20000 [Candidatus Riflebacteria bacterium]|nr:hypothetical protein [Candidatus Riflebacteria bacterium]